MSSLGSAFASDPMIRLESGGNPAAVNRRTGATGLRQFMPSALQAAGVYAPAGADGWGGTFRIPGFENVRTRADFMANPAAQEAANRLHEDNLRREIARRGLAQFFGQTIGGIPIDEARTITAMHFTGPAGTARFLQSGGQHNPSDGNLRLTEYVTRARPDGRPLAPLRPTPPPGPPSVPPQSSPDPGPLPKPGYGQMEIAEPGWLARLFG